MNGRRLTEFGEFRNGQRFGHWIYRYDNGAKRAEGDYVAGRKEGPWVVWREDGKESRVTYHADEPVGPPAAK
jgi:antitoxin component YwqK of YwqJK toxin-antitoxin module